MTTKNTKYDIMSISVFLQVKGWTLYLFIFSVDLYFLHRCFVLRSSKELNLSCHNKHSISSNTEFRKINKINSSPTIKMTHM